MREDHAGDEKRHHDAPRSKLRGITELKHSELPEIFAGLPLPLDIPFDGLPGCVDPLSVGMDLNARVQTQWSHQ